MLNKVNNRSTGRRCTHPKVPFRARDGHREETIKFDSSKGSSLSLSFNTRSQRKLASRQTLQENFALQVHIYRSTDRLSRSRSLGLAGAQSKSKRVASNCRVRGDLLIQDRTRIVVNRPSHRAERYTPAVGSNHMMKKSKSLDTDRPQELSICTI
jgi:hypothetical protein